MESSSSEPQLLGEGSYGCVFKPKIPCDGKVVRLSKKAKPKNEISKVFGDKKDFLFEWREGKRLSRIDPSGEHLMIPTGSCATTRKLVQKHPKASSCELLEYDVKPAHHKLYQILMPYGGTRMDKYVSSHVMQHKKLFPVVELLHILDGIMQGVLLMDQKRICHQDIKTGNVLVTPQGEGIIIDFSLMAPYSTIYLEKNHRRLRYTYFPYPPEFKLAYYLIYPEKCDECDMYEMVMKNIYNFGDDLGDIYVWYHGKRDIQKAVQDVLNQTKHVADKASWFKKFANRIDVYSVGVSIFDLHRYLDLKDLGKDELQQWIHWIKGMTHPDPRKRFTPREAYDQMKKLEAILCKGTQANKCSGMKKKKTT